MTVRTLRAGVAAVYVDGMFVGKIVRVRYEWQAWDHHGTFLGWGARRSDAAALFYAARACRPRRPRRLEYMRLADIAPALINPKAHDEELIGDSIGRWGFMETPVLDERTGRLVAGHGRTDDLRARKARSEAPPEGVIADGDDWLVPVLRGWQSSSDDDAHAAGVALNRIGERGGWTPDLANVLDILDSSDGGLIGVGYDRADIDEMLQSLTAPLDIDDMGARYGQSKPEALWPVIRLQVPPPIFDRYLAVLNAQPDGDELARFTSLLEVIERAMAEP